MFAGRQNVPRAWELIWREEWPSPTLGGMESAVENANCTTSSPLLLNTSMLNYPLLTFILGRGDVPRYLSCHAGRHDDKDALQRRIM